MPLTADRLIIPQEIVDTIANRITLYGIGELHSLNIGLVVKLDGEFQSSEKLNSHLFTHIKTYQPYWF